MNGTTGPGNKVSKGKRARKWIIKLGFLAERSIKSLIPLFLILVVPNLTYFFWGSIWL